MVNFYQVLGVKENATQVEIKAAYKKLAIAYHPDKNGGNKAKEDIFKSITEAYTTLSDPEKRIRHDQRLAYYRFQPSQTQYNHSGRGPVGPNPYGNPFTYSDFSGGAQAHSQGQPGNWRPSTQSRRVSFASMHDIAIGLLIMACIFTAGIWVNSVMSRRAAEAELAEGDYIEALNFDKNYAPAWFASAKAKMRSGNYEGSLEDLNRAILLSDTVSAFWHVKKAELQVMTGNDEQARRGIRTFLKQYPKVDSVKLILAAIYLRRARADSALAVLNTVAINDEAPRPYRTVYNHLAGLANFHTGGYLMAEKFFSRNADFNHNVPQDLYLRGLTRLRLSDSTKAFDDLTRAAQYGSGEADSLLVHDFNHSTQP